LAKAYPLPSSLAARNVIDPILPIYPEEAVRIGVSGVVRIKIEIGEDGEVLRVKVKPRTNPHLKTAVVDAVKQWRFRPWRGVDGGVRAVISRLTFRFTIKDGEPHVTMYDPAAASQTECLGCYDSALELREWREWEDVPMERSDRKP
jgi:TonB family protein